MKGFSGRVIRVVACAALAAGLWGCAGKDARNQAVATANGETIDVREVREFLGIRGGVLPATDVPVKKKEDAVGRLVAGRLLAQEARAKGLAASKEFRDIAARNEQVILITALFRKEIESMKVSKGDIREEAEALRRANKALSEKDADSQARLVAIDRKIKKIEDGLVAKARKEFPATVDRAAIQRIGAGDPIPEDAVLASVGNEKIRYGDVVKIIGSVAGSGGHGGQDMTKNPVAVEKTVDRELSGLLLAAYARKSGVAEAPQGKAARADVERSILIDLYAAQLVKDISVTDADIAAAYTEHEKMLVRDGKKIPLAQVRPQIREFLENDRKRKALDAYVEEIKKKAKITVDAAVLQKV